MAHLAIWAEPPSFWHFLLGRMRAEEINLSENLGEAGLSVFPSKN